MGRQDLSKSTDCFNDDYMEYEGASYISVTIAKADPETPTGLTAVYGQTLADVTLPQGWSWADSSLSVGNVGTNSFNANYTADNNHNSKTNVSISVKVTADNTSGGNDNGNSGNTGDGNSNSGNAGVSDNKETVDSRQKTTSLEKPKAGKKSFTLKWKKTKDKAIAGYEIQYSTDKNFKNDVKTVTISKAKTTSKTIKKLKSKKKYFIRIRTYKKSGAEKIYSKWSKTKSVKVK